MKIYQADKGGWFCPNPATDDGHYLADESPLEPGVFLIPAGAHEDAPPLRLSWGEGLWPRRIGGEWVMQVLPAPQPVQSAAEKLAAFLAANPDVAAMIEGASPGGA